MEPMWCIVATNAASRGTTSSAPVQVRFVVDSSVALAPANVRFADIKTVLQSASSGCTNAGCHGIASAGGAGAPLVLGNIDRHGDGSIGDATDDAWLCAEVRGWINFTAVIASPLHANRWRTRITVSQIAIVAFRVFTRIGVLRDTDSNAPLSSLRPA